MHKLNGVRTGPSRTREKSIGNNESSADFSILPPLCLDNEKKGGGAN